MNDTAPTVLARAPWDGARPDRLRVTAVRTFLCAPQGCPYLIVRVETSEPGLYGLGCASDPQRTLAIRSIVDDYLGPLLVGRDPRDIEDVHRLLLNSAYWRGGSLTGNALAGVDVALWDIKAKAAGVPLYDLLGGRARQAATAYTHVSGGDSGELAELVQAAVEEGFGHVRVQVNVPGADAYGTHTGDEAEAAALAARDGRWDGEAYLRLIPRTLAAVREKVGDGVELLHDVHERLTPAQARRLVRDLEPARLFFLEDALAPEDAAYFPQLRAAGTVPLAVGELFSDPAQFVPLIADRAIDYARIRVPTLGGLTPARKLAAACELFGVQLAPHGPGDVSPVGRAATVALDVNAPSFGIQEAAWFTDATREVFPGALDARGGVLEPAEVPGLGVDFDEAAARRYPPTAPLEHDRWALLRNRDGSAQRP
ncbi:enolase C-terminal domain-like protein [Actinomadura parmotrematis]|uniref:Bifunctional D-altronate/D-mannonate dehydratase n=1 Tax=Actinomadura parmotrematis TaxID=2864039 RepID=A0ABS7G1Z1_9ACTN|nr:enolase C-terminal domain-like protein [Actinomadura parmotrematis]MBW8486727.1 bifunctional D-altronate/D-mannonate dehydratase [Actinomadura parmotrematis]